MEVLLHGVRGSTPTASSDTSQYGGNTTCIELYTNNGTRLFFDAGTGLRVAGMNLPESGEAHVFVSHGHTDHIAGLWFFRPIHSPGWKTWLYFPEGLEVLPSGLYTLGQIPIPFESVLGHIEVRYIAVGETVAIADPENGTDTVLVEAFIANHSGYPCNSSLGFKVRADGALFVYTGDHEITAAPEIVSATLDMLRDADIAVVDAQYNRADYIPGFGHSTWEDWIDLAGQAGVKQLVLSHHEPRRTDQQLSALEQELMVKNAGNELQIIVARERMKLYPDNYRQGKGASHSVKWKEQQERISRMNWRFENWRNNNWMLDFLDELSIHTDRGFILDHILAKCREMTNAQAGTVYLVDDRELVFSYVQNDLTGENREVYSGARLPVSDDSIAGHVANGNKPLNLDNVYELPAGAPYRFNDQYDRDSGFKTRSMLALPLSGTGNRVFGVLQLINCLNPDDVQEVVPFSPEMEQICQMLTREVSPILERMKSEESTIKILLFVADTLNDEETPDHARRVGDVAAALFQTWAERNGHDREYVSSRKGHLRHAAMLHDIGKIGVLNYMYSTENPGITKAEAMRMHPVLGAGLLKEIAGETAEMAREIARHHHQRWDGKGYVSSEASGALGGTDIPLEARITSVADSFDIMITGQIGVPAIPFDAALEELNRQKGLLFDPEIVECMHEISETLRAIYSDHIEKKLKVKPWSSLRLK